MVQIFPMCSETSAESLCFWAPPGVRSEALKGRSMSGELRDGRGTSGDLVADDQQMIERP